ELTQFIHQRGAPTSVRLPREFLRERGFGCNAAKMNGIEVGMLCFRVNEDTYFLYTMKQEQVPHPKLPKAIFIRIDDETFATWTCSGQIHIIRTRAPERDVKALLDI